MKEFGKNVGTKQLLNLDHKVSQFFSMRLPGDTRVQRLVLVSPKQTGPHECKALC